MNKLSLSALLVLVIQTLIVIPVLAGEHLLQPKLGIVDWTDDGTHSVKGNNFTFDSDKTGSSGFMYLYRIDNGFAFGGEVYGYTKDYTHSNGDTGDADVGHIYGLVEFYFNNDGAIKPFVGLGLGAAGVDFSGEINTDAAGSSIQLKAGVEFSINERFSLSAEAKYFTIDIDEEIDSQNADIKSKGYAAFIGFTIKI